MNDILNTIKVIDMSGGQAGSIAALLLAESGATVTKMDLSDQAEVLTPVQDAIWNRSKTRRVMATGNSQDLKALKDLIAEADILIHDRVGHLARALGLNDETLTAAHPRLIVVSIGGWPTGHPKADMPVRDSLVLGDAGVLDEQLAVARDGPVYLRFPLGSAHAAYLAAIGALARLIARRRTGRGGLARTSLIQGALIPTMMHWFRAERPTPSTTIGLPKTAGSTLFECGDGLWIHTMGDPLRSPSVLAALEAMAPAERQRLNDKYLTAPFRYLEDRGALEAVFLTQGRQDWLADLWSHDVPVQPVLPMGELFRDEQAIANGYIVDVKDARFGQTRQPGIPMTIQAASAATAGSAVKVGSSLGLDDALDRPLAGLKVLDLGQFLAGPLAPMLLADLGADVIKLETTRGEPLRPQDWAFNGCQRGKRAIALDLKQPEARTVLSDLIGWADVVHHNQRLPAAEKLGFGAEAVRALNPDAIYAHVSSYGPTGPRSDWPGYDQLFQASSGWEFEGAGEGNPPMWHRFGMMDHLCALASTTGVLLALIARQDTGQARGVSASLLGASLFSAETLLGPDGELAPYPKLDRGQTGVSAVDRLYEVRDGWIMIAGPAGAEHDLFDALQALDAHGAEAAMQVLTVAESVHLVKGLGWQAVEVRRAQRDIFFDDADNQAAGLVAQYDHVRFGHVHHVGALWDLGDLRVDVERFTPLLGEHSREILSDLGYSSKAIKDLFGAGAVVETVA